MLRVLFVVPVVVIIGVMGFFVWGLGRDPAILPSMLIDQPAPEFGLPPVAGVDRPGLGIGDLKGQVSLVNFFASWCVPCLAEHPLISRLSEDGVLPVYGVNYKNQPEDARQWLTRNGNPYDRIGSDIDGRVAIDFGVTGMPETFIVDGDGVVRFKQVGPISPAILEDTILPIIEKLQREGAGE